MEKNGLGGACLADRHCSALLSCHFGAESAEAVGKFGIMLSSYTLSVLAVDGVCEPAMWAVGLIVVAVLLFLCCCCLSGCCCWNRTRRGRRSLLEDF